VLYYKEQKKKRQADIDEMQLHSCHLHVHLPDVSFF